MLTAELVGDCQDLLSTLEGVNGHISTETTGAVQDLLERGRQAAPGDPVLATIHLGDETALSGRATLRAVGARVVLQQIEDAIEEAPPWARVQSLRTGIGGGDVIPEQADQIYDALLDEALKENPQSEQLAKLPRSQPSSMSGLSSTQKPELIRRLTVIEAQLQ